MWWMSEGRKFHCFGAQLHTIHRSLRQRHNRTAQHPGNRNSEKTWAHEQWVVKSGVGTVQLVEHPNEKPGTFLTWVWAPVALQESTSTADSLPVQSTKVNKKDKKEGDCDAIQSSGAVWKSRWPSWAPIPNKPTVSVDVKQHFNDAIQLKHASTYQVKKPVWKGGWS